MRLGDFRRRPYCDYGTLNCQSYQQFGISKIIRHEKFGKDKHNALYNDIALIRLDRNITFEGALQPICLPFNRPELDVNTPLIVSGWGEMMTEHDSKQAVEIRLYGKKRCENKHHSIMCAGNGRRSSCQGDSGGPLMHQFERKRMTWRHCFPWILLWFWIQPGFVHQCSESSSLDSKKYANILK